MSGNKLREYFTDNSQQRLRKNSVFELLDLIVFYRKNRKESKSIIQIIL